MSDLPFVGKKFLITAGPTYEAIDPVRFIGNRSTGKQGIAFADVASKMGAEVHLILGPSALRPSEEKVKVYLVESAKQMFDHSVDIFPSCDVAIMSAAVADYRPKKVESQKIKKEDNDLTLILERTPDILKTLGKMKAEGQFLIGFALETDNEIAYATEKLRSKNADLILLNSLQDAGAGFAVDTNRITLIQDHGKITRFGLRTKTEVAADVLGQLAAEL